MKIQTILVALSAFASVTCGGSGDFEREVRGAVECQMERYPASTLKDLYKNFFQDRFGPGHIISDREAAAKYIRQETAFYGESPCPDVEPTGWQHNYVRISLDAVKEGRVSEELLLDALVRSANDAPDVSIEDWRNEWSRIEAIISGMKLSLPDYEADRTEIDARLLEGKYVCHHSAAFNAAYSPHYRIISRPIYESELQGLIE
jgi:hypothetical protein